MVSEPLGASETGGGFGPYRPYQIPFALLTIAELSRKAAAG